MTVDYNDLVICKLNKRDEHLLDDPRALSCGHSYCLKCLTNEFMQTQLIYCSICDKNIYVDKVRELIPNLFIDQIYKIVPEVYTNVLNQHSDTISYIRNVSLSKFDEFFEYQIDEIEIRAQSLYIEIDKFENQLLEKVDKLENRLRKINKGYKFVIDYTDSRTAHCDNEYEKCEGLYKLASIMRQYYDLFSYSDLNALEIVRFDKKLSDLTIKSFGHIKKTINLNARRFKTSKHKVYEYSNQLSSIGDICKLDDEHFIATNPGGDSLIVFEERSLQIVKIITNIQNQRFSFPMAICTNNIDSIYLCDCHNLRVLILNKELNTVINTISALYHPSDVCFDSNYLYVLYSERKQLHKFTSDGVLLTRFELKPTKLASHTEIDPIRVSIQNTKLVVLYSNNKVYIHDIIENSKLVDNYKEIDDNSRITGICYSSPFLLTIHNDGECFLYDLINQFDDKEKEYKITYKESIRAFKRATPCFITYFDECLFVTFTNPNQHWLMKIDIK